jgi:hypothetical protein
MKMGFFAEERWGFLSYMVPKTLKVLFHQMQPPKYGSVNLVPLVNIKIAGKWMFIPLEMVLIGIDPYPYEDFHQTCGRSKQQNSFDSTSACHTGKHRRMGTRPTNLTSPHRPRSCSRNHMDPHSLFRFQR